MLSPSLLMIATYVEAGSYGPTGMGGCGAGSEVSGAAREKKPRLEATLATREIVRCFGVHRFRHSVQAPGPVSWYLRATSIRGKTD